MGNNSETKASNGAVAACEPTWECHTQARLDVCLFNIGVLRVMTGNKAICVTCRPRLKGGGRRAELLKQSDIPVFVLDLVPLEHHAPLNVGAGISRATRCSFPRVSQRYGPRACWNRCCKPQRQTSNHYHAHDSKPCANNAPFLHQGGFNLGLGGDLLL